MLLAVFEDTISLGAIIVGILVAIATLVTVIYGAKWKIVGEAALALAQARGEALEDAKHREADLQEALATSKEANGQMRATIERLESLPNLARIIEAMSENAKHTDEAAERRHHELLDQGSLILAALREGNGHSA